MTISQRYQKLYKEGHFAFFLVRPITQKTLDRVKRVCKEQTENLMSFVPVQLANYAIMKLREEHAIRWGKLASIETPAKWHQRHWERSETSIIPKDYVKAVKKPMKVTVIQHTDFPDEFGFHQNI